MWTAVEETNMEAIFAVWRTGVWTHDPCDSGAALYQLSQQSNCQCSMQDGSK